MGLRCFLYDKTKGAQYASIIEEDDESWVKLLYDRTKVHNMRQLLKKKMKLEAQLSKGYNII
jgi:hypothetical protein